MDDSPTAVTVGNAAERLIDRSPAMPVEQVIAEQRRRRRLWLAAGLALFLIPGMLWAGLTKDPARQNGDDFFGEQAFPVDVAAEPAMAIALVEESVVLVDGEPFTRSLDPFSQAVFDVDLESGDLLIVSAVPFDAEQFFAGEPLEIAVDGPNSGVASNPDPFVGGEVEFLADDSGAHLVRVFGTAPMDVSLTLNPENETDG